MSAALTPYDIGDRLEPVPWSLDTHDRYGLVDFDDEEGTTVLTTVGKTFDDGSEGYLLSVRSGAFTPTVEIDGDRTVVVTEEMIAGMRELADWAERGWEDFCHQTRETDDYSAVDIADASHRWHLAQGALSSLLGDAGSDRENEQEK